MATPPVGGRRQTGLAVAVASIYPRVGCGPADCRRANYRPPGQAAFVALPPRRPARRSLVQHVLMLWTATYAPWGTVGWSWATALSCSDSLELLCACESLDRRAGRRLARSFVTPFERRRRPVD